MRVDAIEIAGLQGIEIPDGIQLGDEFVLTVRVQLFGLEYDTLDVGESGWVVQTIRGALHARLIALDGASVDEVYP